VREGGRERSVEPGVFSVGGEQRPCVGVSPGTSREVIQALADIGYIIEVGDSGAFAVHLGRVEDDSYDSVEACRRAIDACAGPLVRFGTWPHGNHSAFAATGDIDALTIWDFFHRFRGH